MILLCNTFITETRPKIGKGFVNRENLRNHSNFDIFKYSLASLATAYKWTRVILKIELDEIYKHRQDELEQFIKTEFNGFDIHLSWNRNVYQTDWIETYELLNDRLIWFYCNHDHIYVEPNSNYLNSVADKMRNEEEYCTLCFSHWPECIRTAKFNNTGKVDINYKIEDMFISTRNSLIDSIQIITKEVYKHWWFTGSFNNYKFPRPDYFGLSINEIKPVPMHKTILPLKELCRHFDGYQHCTPPILNNKCPAVDIPLGFFENKINIVYGYSDRSVDGGTYLNPKSDYYFAQNRVAGTDYKFNIEDIPLFWNGRIEKISTNDNLNEEEMIQYRIKAIYDSIYYNGFPVDKEVEEKITGLYLQHYSGYSM